MKNRENHENLEFLQQVNTCKYISAFQFNLECVPRCIYKFCRLYLKTVDFQGGVTDINLQGNTLKKYPDDIDV